MPGVHISFHKDGLRPPVTNWPLDGGDTNRMMGINSFTTLAIILSAIFFYRAAKIDGSSSVLWVVLSVVTSLLLLTVLRLGVVGIILGQVGLFLGITFFRIIRKSW